MDRPSNLEEASNAMADNVPPERVDFKPFFREQEFVDFVAPVLVQRYEQRVYALMEEMEGRLPFVGLRHFKQNVLAEALALQAGTIFAELVVDRLIKEGKLEITKVKTNYSEYETSTVSRVR